MTLPPFDAHLARVLFRAVAAIVALVVIWDHHRRGRRGHWMHRGLAWSSVILLVVAAFSLAGRVARAGVPVRTIEPSSLEAEVRAIGAPTVALVLYDPGCGRCRDVLSALTDYVERREGADVRVLAVAFPGDPDRVRALVTGLDARLEGVQLAPYKSGSLVAALRPLGSRVPMSIPVPYVLVLDERRRVVDEWAAMERLADLGAVVDSLRDARLARAASPIAMSDSAHALE